MRAAVYGSPFSLEPPEKFLPERFHIFPRQAFIILGLTPRQVLHISSHVSVLVAAEFIEKLLKLNLEQSEL
jgi:hypothetical protein